MQRLQEQNNQTSPIYLQPRKLLGHPIRLQFSDGSCTGYVYAADGRKLREKHTTAVEGLTVRMGNTLKLTPEQTMAVWQKKFLFKQDYRLQDGAASTLFPPRQL